MNEWAGKAVVVTGGASGIGEAIARQLWRAGARVSILDLNEASFGEEPGRRDSILSIVGNVTEEQSVANFVLETARQFGRIDAGFNVAGASSSAPILDHSVQTWDFMLSLCLKGVMIGVKYQAQELIKSGGAIVNVASICARMPMAGAAAYCAAKSGVEMLTKVAALELAPYAVRVNAILPGYTYTPGMRVNVDAPKRDQAIVDRIPMRRAAQADEIAAPAIFLASADASYVTGASLVVDGGWNLAGA